MKIKKLFIVPFLALLVSGCQEEEQVTSPTFASGEEVRFGASLENITTRTIYGPKNDHAFPIYWIDGDEVIVSSPECANNGGVGQANYKITAEKPDQNYATSMDKTGEIGVRWGKNETGTFYSVYPAPYTPSGSQRVYGATIGNDNKTVTLAMPVQQDCSFTTNSDGTKTAQPDMRACFMYAKTEGVKNGEVVNLHYKPLSTAIRFKLKGPQNGDPLTINYVRIYAPNGTPINGTFTADLSSASGNDLPQLKCADIGNYITFNVADDNGSYLTLAQGDEIELCAFLLLEGNTQITDEWYIEVGTSAVTYKKKIVAAEGTSANAMTLVPGEVHYLPDFPPLSAATWSASNWMTNLQRNVYLSEISIPGSWNSLSTDYQDPVSIKSQYNAGVRAFHLDTRWRADGLISRNITDLGIANGGDTYNVDGGKCMTQAAPTFVDALKQITDNVKDDEYMVVICTFAQGSTVHGNWRKEISDACANNDRVINASTLNENSVVGDVLGKVIVIINTYTEGKVADSKCLFFNMGMTLTQAEFTDNKYYQRPLMYNNITNSGITMYGTHAQICSRDNGYTDDDRGYAPSFSEREEKVNNILEWSKGNYDNESDYAHNAWLYIGLGGYIPGTGGLFGSDDDPSTVASTLNPWFGNIVEGMSTNNSYYPVGIVLMNHTNDYSKYVQDILEMNTKYRKAYNPDRSPVDGHYIGGGGSRVQSAAPGYSSGMIDNGTNAIGWTRVR